MMPKKPLKVFLLGIIDVVFGLIAGLDYLRKLITTSVPQKRVQYILLLYATVAVFVIGILIIKLKPLGRKLGLYLSPVLIIIAAILFPAGKEHWLGLFFLSPLQYLYVVSAIFLIFLHVLVLSRPDAVSKFGGEADEKRTSELMIKRGNIFIIRASAVLYFIMGIENFYCSILQSGGWGNYDSKILDIALGISFVLAGTITFLLTLIKNKDLSKIAYIFFFIAAAICVLIHSRLFMFPEAFSNMGHALATLVVIHDSYISGLILVILSFRIFKRQ